MDYEQEILRQFFYYPMRPFGVRELSRKLHVNTKTVMKYLSKFVKNKVVVRVKKKKSFARYEANRLSRKYKIIKSNALMDKIAASDLMEFLEKELQPKAIVIFGSVQKGTYLKHSDVDIFIQGKEKKIDLAPYEDKLKHDIQLLFEEDLSNLTAGLRNNIINGNTVSGGLEL